MENGLDRAIYERLEFRFDGGCDCGRLYCRSDTWYVTLPGTPFKGQGNSKESAASYVIGEVKKHIKTQQVLYQIWLESKIDLDQTIWDLVKEG